ncbi:MAG: SLC13 family permease [Chitinophagales bacterium]
MYFWLSIAVFVLAYVAIMSEKLHRAIIALTGAALLIVLHVLSQEQAVDYIDFNTIGLLIGMMIIVTITKRSGVFEYLAVKSAQITRGRPLAILAALAVVTAVVSAFLDNVTTVLLIVPVTVALTDRLDVSPMPYLLLEIIASNIGGTATLIGDPPNIMIGSATGLGFLDFAANLAPVIVVVLLATIGVMLLIYRKDLKTTDDRINSLLELNPIDFIKDRVLLKKALIILALTIVGFLLHQTLKLESATIALMGAALLMIISGEEPEETLLSVEWPTIFFFAGLFVIVGAMDVQGVIKILAQESLKITHGNLMQTGMLVLWLSAIASAFIDNIPFVATMLPLLDTVGNLTHMPMESIWWALSLGACLGGNGTLIGASANVIVAGMSERMGNPIRFMDYLKIGFPLMLMSIVICTVYLFLRYWM